MLGISSHQVEPRKFELAWFEFQFISNPEPFPLDWCFGHLLSVI